jgi:hypothetical protein
MKILGYELNRIKNMVLPPMEVETREFTYIPTATKIVSAEISEYKAGFASAHNAYSQQRTKIYDIYQNALDFDAHLKGIIEKRLLNTSGRKLTYLINEEEPEGMQDRLQAPEITNLINDVIMIRFWGMGLFEFDLKSGGYTLIPIKHIDPFEKLVRKNQAGASVDDTSYEGIKNVVFLGHDNAFGLLQQLSLLAMYKRATIGDWAQYSQLAGTNFRTIKYRGAMPDAQSRDSMRTIVNNAGTGTLDLPRDVDIETSNQTSSSQNQLFENYVKYLDDEMTKLVLGQTMTTEDGSSRSQAEVHERVQDDIFDNDAQYVLDIFNKDFMLIMESYGFKGGRFAFTESATATQTEEIERDLKLKELGVIFTDQELRIKYNLNDSSKL